MTETKSYGLCVFCNCTLESDLYGTMCHACFNKYEPEEQNVDPSRPDFEDEHEVELKGIMEDSVKRQKDAHGQEWLDSLKVRSENKTNFDGLPNYKENNVINENKGNYATLALEARRSEALRMAYYTSHKLGHFTMKIPGGEHMTEKQKFLFNIEEVKELARRNMEFIREG